jgi:hypothetical protein
MALKYIYKTRDTKYQLCLIYISPKNQPCFPQIVTANNKKIQTVYIAKVSFKIVLSLVCAELQRSQEVTRDTKYQLCLIYIYIYIYISPKNQPCFPQIVTANNKKIQTMYMAKVSFKIVLSLVCAELQRSQEVSF